MLLKAKQEVMKKYINIFIMFTVILVCIGCVKNNSKVQYYSLNDSCLKEYKIEYLQDSILIYSRHQTDKKFIVEWRLYKNNGEYRKKYVYKDMETIDVLFMSNKHDRYDTIISTPLPIVPLPMEIKIRKEKNGDFSTSLFFLMEKNDANIPYGNIRLTIIYDKDYNIKEIIEPIYMVKYIKK